MPDNWINCLVLGLSDEEQVPFEPHLMEMLRQMPIPVDLMIKQNFRKPASYLAAATADAQGILSANPENGEKLITALEYGAINPSDLHQNGNRLSGQKEAGTSNYVPGGGIIFSSSSFSLQSPAEPVFNPRPRRHSSFHPIGMSSIADESTLDIMDESSQLSGEALEFLSQYTPDTDSDGLIQSVSNDAYDDSKDISPVQDATVQGESLETELFGTIFQEQEGAEVDLDVQNLESEQQYTKKALRGEDILLTEFNV